MDFDWEKIKIFLPFIFIAIVGLPVVVLGSRKPKHKPENEEKK